MKTQSDETNDQTEMDWTKAREQKSDRARTRAIVSVAFSREDFERLDRHVERKGVKISEFIRDAALDRLAADQAPVTMAAAFAAAYYYAPRPTADFPEQSETAASSPSNFVQVA